MGRHTNRQNYIAYSTLSIAKRDKMDGETYLDIDRCNDGSADGQLCLRKATTAQDLH